MEFKNGYQPKLAKESIFNAPLELGRESMEPMKSWDP